MINKRTGLTSSESRRTFFIFMTCILTVGIIAGSYAAVSGSSFLKENALANQYISPLFNGNTLFEIIKNTFISITGIIAVIFCTGFFAVGQPVSIIMLTYRGFGIGLSTAYTYMMFGKSGIYLTLIFIVPKILAGSVVIMLALRESLRLSNIIYSYLFRSSPEENMGKYVRLYCLKFLILIFLAFIIAVADGGINYFFGYLL